MNLDMRNHTGVSPGMYGFYAINADEIFKGIFSYIYNMYVV